MRAKLFGGLLLALLGISGAEAQPVGSIPWSAIGPGLNICGGNQVCTNGTDVTKTANYTIAASDMGGQVNFNGSSLTVTIPAISSTVLAQGMSVTLTNQGSSAVTIASTPTINGCAVANSIQPNGWMVLTSNGTSLDATCSLPLASSSVFGQVKVDGTTITSTNGVITSVGGGGGGGSTTIVAPQGRIYTTSGQPYPTIDVTNTSTMYYGCAVGKNVPYYNGTTDALASIPSCEISLTLNTTASVASSINTANVFDVWYVGGANNVCVATNGAGAGWAGDTGGSNTTPGTGYSAVHMTRGYPTNTNALSNCYNGTTNVAATPVGADQATYVGTIYTTAAGAVSMVMNPAGAAGGTNNTLSVWNAFNQRMVWAINRDTTASYTYNSTTWRPMNNSASNRVNFVTGRTAFIGSPVEASTGYLGGGADGNMSVNCNSTTATPQAVGYFNAATYMVAALTLSCTPGQGLNYATGMEHVQSTGTFTVFPSSPQGRLLVGVPM